MLLNTKHLKVGYKMKKLTERFVSLYKVKNIVLANVVELELLGLVKIHLVINTSRILIYQEQVEGQKKTLL